MTDKVTLFLTSCGRPELLRKTLESFVKFNTYPIEEAIIMEDSGEKGINDFVKKLLPFPTTILYNETRIGQMASINNGLPYLKTAYVFHCEEDWEFYDYGFIEKSLEILKKNNKITSVWLRSHQEIKDRYSDFTINKVDQENYYLIGPNIGNFSFNPGLKTLEVAKMFSPYKGGICEGKLSHSFRDINMTSAITDHLTGYVRHIGWDHHVPTFIEIVFISSVINTEEIPTSFNYSHIRSAFTPEERFEQTKQTIESVFEKIPRAFVVLVESSNLKPEWTEYFNKRCNKFVNFYDNISVRNGVQSIYKAQGEITQHAAFINNMLYDIVNMGVEIKRLWKISGRYYLNEKFNVNNYSLENITIAKNCSDTNFSTVLFSWPFKYIGSYINTVKTIIETDFQNETLGLEGLFHKHTQGFPKTHLDQLGVSGYVSVAANAFFEG